MGPSFATELVDNSQIAFGKRLGLDLAGCTVNVAAARIEDALDRGFWGVEPPVPTPRQVEFAAVLGCDISGLTRREAGAVIEDTLRRLNLETIKREGLAPGVIVTNIHDPFQNQHAISSIRPDGTVYLRGGNGARAWARNLRQVLTT